MEEAALSILRSSVDAAGGRFNSTTQVPVRNLEPLVALCDAWARDRSQPRPPGLYFNGRPGLWHAFDELYPLQDPNRWDLLRKAVIAQLISQGWTRVNEPNGSQFYLPD